MMLVKNTLLAQLKEIHLPAPISPWPPAIGWIGLAVIGVMVFIVLLQIGRKFLRRYRTKKMALTSIRALKNDISKKTVPQIAGALSIIMRRVVLLYFPRQHCAGLQGHQWLRFLANHSSDKEFSLKAQPLIITPYEKVSSADMASQIKLCETWVQQLSVLPINEKN